MKKRLLGCLVASCLLGATSAKAQAIVPPEPSVRGSDFIPLGVLGVTALLASPADKWVARTVRRPQWVRTGRGRTAAEGMSFLGFVGPIATTAITLASSGTHNRRTALTLTNSMLASSVVTGTLKFSVGRARPYVTADSNSRDFQFNRGWHNDDYRSFPSGHSSLAFAFAAAISQERAHNQGRSREFDAAMYGTAALVGLSRIALDKHWFSDVLFGAGLGVTSGLVMSRLAH